MMKNKFIAVLSAAVITVSAVGGVALASSLSDNEMDNQQITIADSVNEVEAKQVTPETNSNSTNFNRNSANNPAKDIYQDMVKLMRDNGFKDAARYMQTGDFDAMTDYMNTLSEEDYDQMIEIMNNNGYGQMGQMMETIGVEGMNQMHNSMGSISGNGGYGMMGQF